MGSCARNLMLVWCVLAPAAAWSQNVPRDLSDRHHVILPAPEETPPAEARRAVPPPAYARPSPTPLEELPAAPARAALPDSVPGYVTSTAQYFAFSGTEAACLLMGYGMLMLPIPFTGLAAVVAMCACMPGVAALLSVMTGDYVSGQRHPLLWSALAGYLSTAMIVTAGAVVEAVLLVALVVLVRNLVTEGSAFVGYARTSLLNGGSAASVERDAEPMLMRSGLPVLAVAGVMAAVAAVAVVAVLLIPPAMSVLSTQMLRSDPPAGNQLPSFATTIRADPPVAKVAARR